MIYNLTDKLKFGEDPKLVIGDTELTVSSDAETVLQLMDALNEKGEAAGARAAAELLFSEKDRKRLKGLRLKIEDYMEVIKAAVALAMGRDPGAAEDAPAGE